MEDRVTDERLGRYMSLTEESLGRVRIALSPKGTMFTVAEDMLRMAKDYFADARNFEKQGMKVDAFACLNYAYGWLDAGARMGLFDVGDDYKNFTLGR